MVTGGVDGAHAMAQVKRPSSAIVMSAWRAPPNSTTKRRLTESGSGSPVGWPSGVDGRAVKIGGGAWCSSVALPGVRWRVVDGGDGAGDRDGLPEQLQPA